MEVSEVRVKLIDNKDDRLKAFCSMTIDNDQRNEVNCAWKYESFFRPAAHQVRDSWS